MSNKVVMARLDINVYVDCPHCDNSINLMDERDTGGHDLNEEGRIVRQACPSGSWIEEHKKFKVENIECGECGGTFNVKELEW